MNKPARTAETAPKSNPWPAWKEKMRRNWQRPPTKAVRPRLHLGVFEGKL